MSALIIKMMFESWADSGVMLPCYETLGAAGADVRANFALNEREKGITLQPMERFLCPTGLRVEIPKGYEMQIRPRSGLALKHGITLVNAPGTIDSDYRGPLGVILINLGAAPYTIHHAERIAQIIISPVIHARFDLAVGLSQSNRGAGGFGSTGLK